MEGMKTLLRLFVRQTDSLPDWLYELAGMKIFKSHVLDEIESWWEKKKKRYGKSLAVVHCVHLTQFGDCFRLIYLLNDEGITNQSTETAWNADEQQTKTECKLTEQPCGAKPERNRKWKRINKQSTHQHRMNGLVM